MGVFAAPDNTFNSPIKRSGKSTIGAATTGSNVGIENTRAVRGDHHNTDMTSKARLNSSFGGFAVSPNGSSSSLKYAQPDSPVKRAKSMFESKKIKSNDKTRSPLKRTQSESSTFSANNLKTTSSAFKKDKMSAMPNLHSSFSGLPPPSPTKAKSSKSKSSTSKEKARGVSFAPTPPSSTAVSGPDPSIAPWCIKKRLMLRYESPSKRQRNACTKIQAVVRGRRARELAYHGKLQRQLATMGQRTKTEKKQIQQDLEAKKARVLEKARSRSTRQAAKPQPVAAANRQNIDELKATNASIREQNKKLSTNCKNLRINNTRLAENQANMKGNRAALEAHHLQLMSDHDKLSRMEKDYIKKVTEHQESYDARHLSAQAEYNARAMYERLIARFTEMVKQCDNADVLLNEIEEHVDVLMAHKRNWITSPFEAETSPKPKPRKSRYAPPSDDEGDQVVSSPPIATKKGAAKTAAAPSPKKTPASPAKKTKDPVGPSKKAKDPASPSKKSKDPASSYKKSKDPASPSKKCKDPSSSSPAKKKKDAEGSPNKKKKERLSALAAPPLALAAPSIVLSNMPGVLMYPTSVQVDSCGMSMAEDLTTCSDFDDLGQLKKPDKRKRRPGASRTRRSNRATRRPSTSRTSFVFESDDEESISESSYVARLKERLSNRSVCEEEDDDDDDDSSSDSDGGNNKKSAKAEV